MEVVGQPSAAIDAWEAVAELSPSDERALEQLHGLRSKVLLVLQPVTPFGACKRPLPARDLERFVVAAARAEFDVRVVPQTHKALNLR